MGHCGTILDISIENLPSGKWRAVVRFKGQKVNGRSRANYDEARQDEARILLGMGAPVAPSDLTVDQMVQHRINHGSYANNSVAILTRVRRHLPQWFCAMPAARVEPKDVQRALDEIPNAHYKHKAKQLLSAAFVEQAVRGNVTGNPARIVPVKVPVSKRIRVPTTEEVAAIIGAAGEEWSLFFRVAAVTSARRGELCGLRHDDLKGTTLRIERSVEEVKGKTAVKDIKTGEKGKRTISIIKPVADALGALERTSAYLFDRSLPDGTRTYRKPLSASQAFDRTAKRLGLRYSINSLRHFGATQMLGSPEVDVATVAKRLGHSSPAMLLKTYAHWLPLRDEHAASLLDF